MPQTDWSIRRFAKTACTYRTIQIQVSPRIIIIIAVDTLSDDPRQALEAINRRPAH